MQRLTFLMLFAMLQQMNGGREGYVQPVQLQRAYGMARTTVWRMLKELMEYNIIKKPKRGQYLLNAECEYLRALAFCILTPLDMMEYERRVRHDD